MKSDDLMKKWAYYLIVSLVLIAFALLMNSGNYWARPMSKPFSDLEHSLQREDWEQAEKNCRYLMLSWRQVVPRIQYSVEKDEINAINLNLARIKAYIALREGDEAYVELIEAMEHWENLNH
ncbi:MAG: DUF4363 family protein [Syntrophomonadaceae bacterium]|jgi:CelD/BcsL family acetyltransferase involved in cellulose biosynthesis|nr:DUF4363 family protein [Syntrophomonadaceae bacterium]